MNDPIPNLPKSSNPLVVVSGGKEIVTISPAYYKLSNDDKRGALKMVLDWVQQELAKRP